MDLYDTKGVGDICLLVHFFLFVENPILVDDCLYQRKKNITSYLRQLEMHRTHYSLRYFTTCNLSYFPVSIYERAIIGPPAKRQLSGQIVARDCAIWVDIWEANTRRWDSSFFISTQPRTIWFSCRTTQKLRCALYSECLSVHPLSVIENSL